MKVKNTWTKGNQLSQAAKKICYLDADFIFLHPKKAVRAAVSLRGQVEWGRTSSLKRLVSPPSVVEEERKGKTQFSRLNMEEDKDRRPTREHRILITARSSCAFQHSQCDANLGCAAASGLGGHCSKWWSFRCRHCCCCRWLVSVSTSLLFTTSPKIQYLFFHFFFLFLPSCSWIGEFFWIQLFLAFHAWVSSFLQLRQKSIAKFRIIGT